MSIFYYVYIYIAKCSFSQNHLIIHLPMKSCGILFLTIVLLGFCVTKTDGLFESLNLQEYVDKVVDIAKFKLDGILSVNDSTVSRIWSFFKTTYGRSYSSTSSF